jgi:hypothetical protein
MYLVFRWAFFKSLIDILALKYLTKFPLKGRARKNGVQEAFVEIRSLRVGGRGRVAEAHARARPR